MKGPQLIKPKSRNLKVNWLRRFGEGRGYCLSRILSNSWIRARRRKGNSLGKRIIISRKSRIIVKIGRNSSIRSKDSDLRATLRATPPPPCPFRPRTFPRPMHNTGRDFYYHGRSYQPCRAELLKEMELLGAREVGRDRSNAIGLKKSEERGGSESIGVLFTDGSRSLFTSLRLLS